MHMHSSKRNNIDVGGGEGDNTASIACVHVGGQVCPSAGCVGGGEQVNPPRQKPGRVGTSQQSGGRDEIRECKEVIAVFSRVKKVCGAEECEAASAS
jgi:hypothetical protein